MTRDRVGGRPSRRWNKPSVIAAVWVVIAVAFSMWIAENEESKDTPHNHGRVMFTITIAFLVAPLIAGLIHRSRRVGGLVALYGILGWIVSALYFASVYSSIGGGP
jgi:surface polysaccharide O-acyltransferase-like enzyme